MIDEPGSSPRGAFLFAAALCTGALAIAQAQDAAAQASPPRRTADPAVVRALQDHHWTLQSAGDAAGLPIEALLPAGHPIVMNFIDARLSIRGACNQMNGSWRLSPQTQLMIGRMAATMKACEPALMAADSALSAALEQPLGVELTRGATPSLRLSTASRQVLTFSGQPTLRSLYGAPKRIFLEVAEQTVDCTLPSGEADRCLRVREVRFDEKGLRKGPPGPWRTFTGRIEGYTHTPGVRNVLRVDRYERKPAPAGKPSALYVLDLVIESGTVAGK
ncbi:MAG: META domain-containing protein [Burkholderiales bacterium]